VSAHDLVEQAVAAATAAGATSADAMLLEDDGVTVLVRDGRSERVEEHCSRGIGVRAFRGTRLGLAYTNDLSPEAVAETARRAEALAEVAAEDEFAGLPDADHIGVFDGDLDGADAAAGEWSSDTWIDVAKRCEIAAREDSRITMSEGARAGGGRRRMLLANSNGLLAERNHSTCYTAMGVFATGDSGERQRDSWSSMAAHFSDLQAPDEVGREAARRAIRRCGYRKPKSGAFPVIFSPEVARDLAGTLAQAVSGGAVFRRATFLADSLGEQIGSDLLTLVDDPTLPRHVGSRGFDGEGVRSRRTVLVDGGRLESWLADSYAARRLGVAPTGNASRSFDSPPGVAPSNLVLMPGESDASELIGDVQEGLYVTELFGMGVNLASGAWSRGAGGLWIEKGELTHAVQELTIAGDLPSMLKGITAVASDLHWHGRSAAPTLRIDGLTIAS